jgi:hypothetical protein
VLDDAFLLHLQGVSGLEDDVFVFQVVEIEACETSCNPRLLHLNEFE